MSHVYLLVHTMQASQYEDFLGFVSKLDGTHATQTAQDLSKLRFDVTTRALAAGGPQSMCDWWQGSSRI